MNMIHSRQRALQRLKQRNLVEEIKKNRKISTRGKTARIDPASDKKKIKMEGFSEGEGKQGADRETCANTSLLKP